MHARTFFSSVVLCENTVLGSVCFYLSCSMHAASNPSFGGRQALQPEVIYLVDWWQRLLQAGFGYLVYPPWSAPHQFPYHQDRSLLGRLPKPRRRRWTTESGFLVRSLSLRAVTFVCFVTFKIKFRTVSFIVGNSEVSGFSSKRQNE